MEHPGPALSKHTRLSLRIKETKRRRSSVFPHPTTEKGVGVGTDIRISLNWVSLVSLSLSLFRPTPPQEPKWDRAKGEGGEGGLIEKLWHSPFPTSWDRRKTLFSLCMHARKKKDKTRNFPLFRKVAFMRHRKRELRVTHFAKKVCQSGPKSHDLLSLLTKEHHDSRKMKKKTISPEPIELPHGPLQGPLRLCQLGLLSLPPAKTIY